ncbi:class I SAM-dependent methyltransferase [Vulcanimicrobium alpinum]|uniref:class I SAM-dependent methyltransferase n=1 Tax=Vulcanimicrobium alpinum TaxID=3016050 RepID=UPI00295E8948|nr:class I SAM-dependent methyltransferase [Vulcanimicrobium alpinum]
MIAYAGEHTLNGPVLEVGTGSGRNTRALVAAGLEVVSVPDETPYTQLPGARDAYAAAISTHAYLHGTSAKLRAGIAELRRVLRPGAAVFLTLGSIADDRYGLGLPFDERSFAPGDGDEAGIPHVYLDRDGVIETLFGFTVESLEEVAVNEIAGRWAHDDDDPARRVHWFVIARKNAPAAAAQ